MRRKRKIALILVIILLPFVAARIALPYIVTDYVNKVINRIDGYEGSVKDIDIHLYRGAYSIHQLKIMKKNGDIPVPFIDIQKTDLSIQWSALFRGAIVGNVDLVAPQLNFATGKSGRVSQTGAEADWNQPIKDLMPLDINKLTASKGKLTYENFSTDPVVNVFIDDIALEATNLRNIEDKEVVLPSTFHLTGTSIGKGVVTAEGKINILPSIPDFDINMKLENMALPAINTYSKAYAAVDFSEGNLNIYSELAASDGKVTGYVKPVAENVSYLNSSQDKNIFNIAWESFVSMMTEILKNKSKDQIATRIPLSGNLNNPDTSFWPTLGGILRNGFVEAFSKSTDGDINFSTAEESKN